LKCLILLDEMSNFDRAYDRKFERDDHAPHPTPGEIFRANFFRRAETLGAVRKNTSARRNQTSAKGRSTHHATLASGSTLSPMRYSPPFVGRAAVCETQCLEGKNVAASNANLILVQQHCEVFNRGDMDAAAEFFAEDSRNHGRQVGRAGVRAVLKDIQSTFPDVQQTILDSVVEAKWVVVRCTFSGTHRGVGRIPVCGGMLVGVQPTGRHFEVQHIHIYRVRNSKIAEHFANRNDIGMMQQLGLLPAGH